jgi:membrane-bound lytic murein transglycosylase D
LQIIYLRFSIIWKLLIARKMIKNKGKFIIVGIGLIGLVLVFTFSSSKKTPIPDKTVENSTNFAVEGIKIPEKIDFAGERVPLELFDIKEALERELLINSYWHSQTIMLIKKSTRYFGVIEAILKKYNIPLDFKYLAVAESGFSNASSPQGAVGFWQFVPATAKDYGLEVNEEVDERYHIEKSTEAACKFLKESYNLYKTWTMAAASYNVGRSSLNKQIQRQYSDYYYDILLNEETARYLFRIVALKIILNNPQKFGFKLPPNENYQPIPYTEVAVDGPIKDLAQFAFDKGTNYKILKQLNPWLRDNFLTNSDKKTYMIKIPKSGIRKYANKLTQNNVDSILSQSEKLVQ